MIILISFFRMRPKFCQDCEICSCGPIPKQNFPPVRTIIFPLLVIRVPPRRFKYRQTTATNRSTCGNVSSKKKNISLSKLYLFFKLYYYIFYRYIVRTEGFSGLFKGLGPNLVGVAPSRAIYFFTYDAAKKRVNSSLPVKNRDTPFVHVVSAATAGI